MLLLGSLTVIAACTADRQTDKNDEQHHHAEAAAPKAVHIPSARVNLRNDKLNAVYPHYMQLTQALTKGDAEAAKIAAIAIETGAGQITGAAKFGASAGRIVDTGDIALQRKAYAALSNDFIALLKDTGMDGGELYIAHCPMAMDDQGADWVTNSKEIRNPYFGESMLTCGMVKETLK